jgi:hypothetical protein
VNVGLAYQIWGIVAGAVLIPVGMLVLFSAHGRRANLLLAGYLLWGWVTGALVSFSVFVPNPTVAYNAVVYLLPATDLFFLFYLAFVGQAVASPLSRWLRTRFGLALVVLFTLLKGALELVFAQSLWPSGRHSGYGGYFWDASPTNVALNLETVAIYAFTLVCTTDAFRRAEPGTIARSRAKAYLQAFALIDGSIVVAGIVNFAAPQAFYGVDIIGWAALVMGLVTLTQAVGGLMIVRGMLRYQLFDFDLKLKWTLKRGTLVAIILGAFFLATALAEQYLQQFGWVIGGLAVGALLFALRPIERAIDRMADRAMPRTTGTPEYLAQRKHEIYRAALEDAMRDGVVSAKERALLLRLAENLGLSGDESTRIERNVLEASA